MYSANPFYPTGLHRPTLVDAELHNASTDNATQHNRLLLSSSSLLSAPPCHCDQHHWGCLHLQPDSDIRWLIWLAHWLLSDFRSMISVIRQRQAAASRDRKWRHEHQRSWYVGYLGGRSLWWKEKECQLRWPLNGVLSLKTTQKKRYGNVKHSMLYSTCK